jgi:glycerate kinase
MKILIATDAFKDALSAMEACQTIQRGLLAADSTLNTVLFPLADGGEGTAEILTFHAQGKTITLTVHDPLFRQIEASYGISANGKTAFIEMAQAAGLQRLAPNERNPLHTSTYGVGEMIRDALHRGAEKIILGIGGSATNDAGIGMAHALGFSFLDENGNPLTKHEMTGKNLSRIQKISLPRLFLPKADKSTFQPFNNINFKVLCDVNNPLYGEIGAAHVYAPQKGADEAAVTELDMGLRHFAQVLDDHFEEDFVEIPGAGAAGGLGAGAMAFLGAKLKPGIQTVLELTKFDDYLQDVDWIITGEGKIDRQTLHGKLIKGITERAKQRHIPVIALCGSLLANPSDIERLGLQAAFSIANQPMNLAEALDNAESLLEQTAWQVGRLLV